MRTHPEIPQTAKPLSEQQHLPVWTGLKPVVSWAKALYSNPPRCAIPRVPLAPAAAAADSHGTVPSPETSLAVFTAGNPDGYFSFFAQSGPARLS